MNGNNYVFFGDLFEYDGSYPVEIIEGFTLKKATSHQIKEIKRYLDGKMEPLHSKLNKFENDFKIGYKEGLGVTTDIVKLDEVDWKYQVLEFDSKFINHNLDRVFALSSLDFTVLFESIQVGENRSIKDSPLKSLNFLFDSQHESCSPLIVKKITDNQIKELNSINYLIKSIEKEKYPYMAKALMDLIHIKNISCSSPFKILSYFSIFELLLTSIKCQGISFELKNKINLINNRLPLLICVHDYFDCPQETTFEETIEILYKYRNDIAHGNLLDFDKRLSMFKTQQNKILPFLNDLLRSVLLYSIENPQEVKDLKKKKRDSLTNV